MKSLEALQTLQALNQSVLSTKHVAMILGISHAHASKLLSRLAETQTIFSLKRGLWLIDKTMSPYHLVPYLTAPFPSYISCHTALYFHGMISQIPEVIYVATIGRTQKMNPPVGHYSCHHIHPDFFFGYELNHDTNIWMATPEKALIDYLYLSPAKSKLFYALPELELDALNIKDAYNIIQRIPSKRTRSLVSQKLHELLER